MPKQKYKRRGAKLRTNPIGAREASTVGNAVQTTSNKSEIAPVVTKLSSADDNERVWAAASLSNLIADDEETRKLLYSNNIVNLLIDRLGDTQPVVVEETLGALRNLVSVDPIVAKELYAKDILTPLKALLPTISNTIDKVLNDSPCENADEMDRRRTVWDMAENFIYIIWVISEASSDYIKAVNRLNIIIFLLSFFSHADRCPPRVVLAAGQCLMTLTDDNKDINIEFQNHREYIDLLFNVLKSCEAPVVNARRSTTVPAILLNVREAIGMTKAWDEESDVLGELSKVVLPILVATLPFDIEAAANEVAKGNLKDDLKSDMMILQLALELLSDICAEDNTDEDGWETADVDMEDDEESEVPEAGEEDETANAYLDDMNGLDGSTATADAADQARSNPVLQTVVNQVIPHLFRLGTPLPQSFPTQEADATDGLQGVALIHLRALECLNNFLLAANEMPSKLWFVDHASDAIQAWRWLFDTARTIAPIPHKGVRDALLEIIVSCLWALGRGLGQQIPAEPADLTALFEVYHSVPTESMQVKVIGCMNPIAMRQQHVEANKHIGCFILEILLNIEHKKTRADPAIEALNFFYDVYSDCAFDYDEPVFVQLGFLNKLKHIVPHVKQMVKTIDRRKHFDLRIRGDEALTNLTGFIKYKTQERR